MWQKRIQNIREKLKNVEVPYPDWNIARLFAGQTYLLCLHPAREVLSVDDM